MVLVGQPAPDVGHQHDRARLAEQRAVVLNAAKAITLAAPDHAALTKGDDAVILSEGIAHRLIDRLLA